MNRSKPCTVSAHLCRWALKAPRRITGRTMTEMNALVVEVCDGTHIGRGEGRSVYYRGETPESLLADAEKHIADIARGVDRQMLQEMLPPGGVRSAFDAALWDLEAKSTGRRVWELAGIEARPIQSVFTLSIKDDLDTLAADAQRHKSYPILKIKLDSDRPVEKIEIIRKNRPDATLLIDANGGWSMEQLIDILPAMKKLGVGMIEQPLPRGGDDALEGFISPIPLCADESFLHSGEFDHVVNRYQIVNIKLDKTGGLTEGLNVARTAPTLGLDVMTGCMGGTSLSVAPAFIVGLLSRWVDIDGPLMLTGDRSFGLSYQSGLADLPDAKLWG